MAKLQWQPLLKTYNGKGDITMKTIKEVASIFKVHFRTVYAWIKQGKIQAQKYGRKHLISDEEVERIKRQGL